ncbi:MAG: cytochrome c-type biogenesis protein CcmH [Azospirillaceae bacterium]|nr:cytochrome c-type biogenesis protein CcmH [Azospirillaceae bacterium]
MRAVAPRRRRMMALLLLSLSLLLRGPSPAIAVEPDEMLADPVLEARARAISEELRCLVCQNESIDDSHADLAHDLRLLVRERLTRGDSDAQVMAFLTDRYGDFVLLRPPFKTTTAVLWLGPFAILAVGAAAIGLMLRNRRRTRLIAADGLGDDTDELTARERTRLDQLMAEDR